MTDTQSLIILKPPPPLTLDQAIVAWLKEKHGKSGSTRTRATYETHLYSFRALLQSYGLDLDSDPAYVAVAASGWAESRAPVQFKEDGTPYKREDGPVSAATFNLRICSLSSFYIYCLRNDILEKNPMVRIPRRTTSSPHAARPIGEAEVRARMSVIDTSTLSGKRDLALLGVLLATGRRVSEVAGLRLGHLQRNGQTCTVTFVRLKGNKQGMNELKPKATHALYEYLDDFYGEDRARWLPDKPVWAALAAGSINGKNRGNAMGTQSIANVCKKYLGTSKVHATRHSWAVWHAQRGASLQVIGKGLGHSNLAITSRYLEDHLPFVDPLANLLEEAFFGE